jgi:hypothetical protein
MKENRSNKQYSALKEANMDSKKAKREAEFLNDDNTRKDIIFIDVNLGNGKSARMAVKEEDSAFTAAQTFAL